MNYKKRYIIAALICIAGLTAGLPFIFKKNDTTLFARIDHASNVQEAVTKALEEQHAEIIEAVRVDFNIPENAWNHAMNENKTIQNNDRLMLDKPVTHYKKGTDEIANHVKELLADAGINPDKVAIQYVSNLECPLTAVQEFNDSNQIISCIQIDKTWFAKQNPAVRDALIAHEMVHLKHYDSIEGGTMIEIVLEHGFSREEYEASKAVRNYRHFREIRADVLAGITDITIAMTLQEVFENYMKNNAQFEDNHHHPASSMRYEQMAMLINHMNTEQQAVNA